MAVSAPTASAAPWSCDAFGYLFQTPAGTPLIYQVDLATGQFTSLPGGTDDLVNAVGYNSLDNFFYAWSNPLGTVVRIHDDGTLEPLPLPAGVVIPATTGTSYNVGDVDPDGHYWMLNNTVNPDLWYEIDLAPGSPTYGQVLNQGTIPIFPATLAGPVGSDWAWVNGALYSVVAGSAGGSHLVSFTAAGGVVDHGAIPVTSGPNFGAVYVDAAGYLYASENTSGSIYRINPVTGQTILASSGPPSGFNDGGRCANAPIPTITVTKTVDDRVRPADQFTVGLVRPDGSPATSVTTAAAETFVSTVDFPASQGQTYTITDAMAAGSPTPLGEYVKSVVCRDSAGTVVATGGAEPNWTLLVGQATNYTCDVTNKASADLELVKTASPSPVVPGEDVTFSITATNKGPSTSIGETIRDQLPAAVTFSSASPGCSEADSTVTCDVGELAPGASKTVTITGRVASSLSQCLSNTATVTGKIDPILSNNSSSICPPIRGRSDLKITKDPSRTQVGSGGQVMFTLVVENDGPSDDPGVEVLDPLVPGLTLVAADPSQGTCTTANNTLDCDLGALKDGGSAHVLVTAQVSGTQCVTNTARVRGAHEDPTPANNQDDAQVCPTPEPDPRFDLAVTKTVNDKTLVIGQRATYRVVVRNNGPDAAPSAKVTDTLNAPVTVVSVKSTQGSCTKAIPMTCELGTIQSGASVTITVVVKHRKSGCKQRNAASATGAGTDTNPANNMDTVDVCVRKVRLTLSKVASRSSVRAGDTLSYQIRVRNPSKGEARNVKVCDRLPSGLSFVSSSPKAKRSGGQRCWTIKSLKAGKSRAFRVTVRAAKGAIGRKVNRATLSGPDSKRLRAKDPVRVLGQATPVTG